MDTEKITYEEVLNTAQVLKNSSDEMRNICDEVERLMNTLRNSWNSAAAEQFASQFSTLKTKFPGFYEAVQNYSTFLNNTVQTYRDADAAINNASSGLSV